MDYLNGIVKNINETIDKMIDLSINSGDEDIIDSLECNLNAFRRMLDDELIDIKMNLKSQ